MEKEIIIIGARKKHTNISVDLKITPLKTNKSMFLVNTPINQTAYTYNDFLKWCNF